MNKTLLSILVVALVASLCAIYLISPVRHEISSFQLAEDEATVVQMAEDAPSTEDETSDAEKAAWETFKEKFNKVYLTEEKETKAFENWLKNKKKISSFSASETWVKGETIFSDLTQEEFARKYLMSKAPKNVVSGGASSVPNLQAPASVDWLAAGKVTPVKNQGECLSCWAFAAIASLESLSLIRDKKMVTLSEQQLIDCAGLNGCSGGTAGQALMWSKTNGNTLAASYPYVGKTQSNQKCSTLKSSMLSYGMVAIPKGKVDKLAEAVALQPVTVTIDATNLSTYKSGIMTGTSSGKNLHVVLAVGYTSSYWLLKNSWGTKWGEKGYLRIARGNTLGIADYAYYPKPKA